MRMKYIIFRYIIELIIMCYNCHNETRCGMSNMERVNLVEYNYILKRIGLDVIRHYDRVSEE